MPFKALVNGKEVQSWTYTRKEWKELDAAKKRGDIEITMCCCGSPAILRAGSRIQHFAHYPGSKPETCNWKRKSPEHEKVQYIIAKACHEAGWQAEIEVPGPGYIADVLATKDDKRIAFEVQLERQTLEGTIERREKFAADDVKDYWLFKNLPAPKRSSKKHKRFDLLVQDNDDFYIQHPRRKTQLSKFVKRVLKDNEREPKKHEPVQYGYVTIPDVTDPLDRCIKTALRIGIYAAFIGLLYALFIHKRK